MVTVGRQAIRSPLLPAALAAATVLVLALAAGAVAAVASRPPSPIAEVGQRTTLPQPVAPATPVPPAEFTSPVPAVETSSPLVMYEGLGTWIDIYDGRAWDDPAAAVADMKGHGVTTLYLETGNSRSRAGVFRPSQAEAFIREAHAAGIQVVAWYLPSMKDLDYDYARVKDAIEFRTADGQAFDSFALDIESTGVRSVRERNRRLVKLTGQIRALVGPDYALGGIIPSPVGIAKAKGYWNDFPYSYVAKSYDVLLPMAYYTYHGDGPAAAARDARANMSILRSRRGCATVPVHIIGGVAEYSSSSEARAWAAAVPASQVIGASLYGWMGTTHRMWSPMARFRR